MDGVRSGGVVRRERNGVMTGVATGTHEASWQWEAWLGLLANRAVWRSRES